MLEIYILISYRFEIRIFEATNKALSGQVSKFILPSLTDVRYTTTNHFKFFLHFLSLEKNNIMKINTKYKCDQRERKGEKIGKDLKKTRMTTSIKAKR